MNPPLDTGLALRALSLLGLIGFGFWLAVDRGLVVPALTADKSHLSYVILGLYVVASAHWLWLAHTLAGERRHCALLERALEADARAWPRAGHGLIGRFMDSWRSKGEGGDPATLLAAFGDELANRHAFGHFASDALLKLGLLGTIVGFILMLLPVGDVEEFDATLIRQLLSAMSGGMAVALYTTLAGLVTSTLLKLQYHILDASAAQLATRLTVLADVHSARVRQDDGQDGDAP